MKAWEMSRRICKGAYQQVRDWSKLEATDVSGLWKDEQEDGTFSWKTLRRSYYWDYFFFF